MSRIGRMPIEIPAGVTAKIDGKNVNVKGPLGELKTNFFDNIDVSIDGNVITVTRQSEDGKVKALHGLTRALIYNMVTGVTKGYTRTLTVAGVGYKVAKSGNKLIMNIGFSHPVEFSEGDGVTFEVPNQNEIIVKGIDKDKVGQVASNIRAAKPVEPYHLYGIRYKEEKVTKKEGKTAGKK